MIAVLPQEGPLITGEEKIYASGDILGLNCTSGKSHPASTFKWFINGKQVREWRKLGGNGGNGYSASSLSYWRRRRREGKRTSGERVTQFATIESYR